MTALDEYDRLEAVAVLKRSGEDEGTEVVVTFGEATLTMNALTDGGDTPISHWSLAAIDLIEKTDSKAVYSLNAMTEEVLEVEDDTFQRALAKVLQDRRSYGTAPKGRRKFWIAGGLLGVGALAYLFLPAFVANVAKGMISPERAELLATEMIPMIEDRTGPPCGNASGLVVLEELAERINPSGGTSLRVHDLGDANVISLPGGTVLINRAIIEAAPQDTLTAWVAIGVANVIESPAISELFENQGLMDGLGFLASGQLSRSKKEAAVNRLLTSTSTISPVVMENAAQLLANANLPGSGLEAIRAGTPSNGQADILSAQKWAALRGICSG